MAVAEVHPSAEELASFMLGTLGHDMHASIEAHVVACPSCQERAAVAPRDNFLELLRCAHAHKGREADTVTAPAQAQTPPPFPPAGAPVSLVDAVASPARAESDRLEVLDALPPELVCHERYRVGRILGAGGMGVVYEAEHRVMQRPVALKVINRAYTANATAVARFRREVRAAALLAHPNIVTTYDAEDAGGRQFLVMEYVEGVGLGRVVKERGPLPVAEACACVRQAALGLQHAHERGMVHRDVKPDNLIRCTDGTVKVLDFGLAVLAAERGGGLTDTNVVMGTPDYMAPEQAVDPRTADIRADVYSLGCTLYYLLTGRVPYPASTSLLKILAHREQPLPSIRQARPEVPPELAGVLAHMLAKKPEERYQTPGEVAAALVPFTHPQAAEPPRKRRPLLVAVALAALFSGLLLAGGVVYRIQTDTGELVIRTESPDVEVVIKHGGKLVRIIDTKTDKQITLALRSGVYELELKGAPEGLKLDIRNATLRRGEQTLAKIERVSKPAVERKPLVDGIREVRRFEGDSRKWVGAVAISPDGRQVLTTTVIIAGPGWRQETSNTLRLYEFSTGKQVRTFEGSIRAMSVAISSDGKTAITGGDKTVRIWKLATGKAVSEWRTGHREPAWEGQVLSVAFSPDGQHAFSASFNGDVIQWEVATGKEVHIYQRNAIIPSMALSANGQRLAILAEPPRWVPNDGFSGVRVFDVPTGKELCAIPTATTNFGTVCITPDGQQVAWGHADGTIRVWDVKADREVMQLPFIQHAIQAIAFSPDGKRLFATTETGFMRLWDARSGQRIDDYATPAGVRAVAFSPDGRFVITGHYDGHARLFRLPGLPGVKDNP